MSVTIRPIEPRDLAEVHVLIGQLARHHGDEPRISLAQLQHQIFTEQRGHVLVAEGAGVLAGYALILPRPNLVTGGAGWDINHLFVRKPLRGQGIGRALIVAAAALARDAGAEILLIGTQAANLEAQAAYLAMGLPQLPMAGPRFQVALE
jgi:GNAT superfamily N-acetyltransferase